MTKLTWATIYVLTFVVSLGGGAMLETSLSASALIETEAQHNTNARPQTGAGVD